MHNKWLRDKMLGVYAFWHKLNEVVAEIKLENNPLQWDVQSVPIVFADTGKEIWTREDERQGEEQSKPSLQKFLRATDDGLPIGTRSFTDSYYVETVAEWIESIRLTIADIKNAKVNSLGSIANRGALFCSVDIGDAGKIAMPGNHEHLTRLTFLKYFNMQQKRTIKLVGFDAVCQNTENLTLCFDSPFCLQTKMTKNAGTRIEKIPMDVSKVFGFTAMFQKALQEMGNKVCTVDKAEKVFAGFENSTFKTIKGEFQVDKTGEKLSTKGFNRVQRLVELFKGGDGIGNDGNGFDDLLNANTQFYGRESSGDTSEKQGDALTVARWKQFESAEFGRGETRKAEFFRAITSPETAREIESRGEKLLKDYASAN